MSDSQDLFTQENLQTELTSGWNELQTYITSLTEAQLTQPSDAAGWTVKDHIIHLAMWEKAGIATLEGKSSREAMDVPSDIWKQGDDPINAVIQARYHDMPLDEVMQTFQQIHDAILEKINSMTDADLQLPYSHYQPDADYHRPIFEFIVGSTAQHYREHIVWMKAIAGAN